MHPFMKEKTWKRLFTILEGIPTLIESRFPRRECFTVKVRAIASTVAVTLCVAYVISSALCWPRIKAWKRNGFLHSYCSSDAYLIRFMVPLFFTYTPAPINVCPYTLICQKVHIMKMHLSFLPTSGLENFLSFVLYHLIYTRGCSLWKWRTRLTLILNE